MLQEEFAMKKSRLTDSQIMVVLKQHEQGVVVADFYKLLQCCPVNLKYIAVQQVKCLAIRVF